ncbi:MAG TPA: biotin--[acetyl-CoA-carboxylase] ligase, partial [Sediminispirochaeta sp.]|nr:biotin--[acetyl-CoA-carboxylase] ligase [Sediminispirochaeta sp.]
MNTMQLLEIDNPFGGAVEYHQSLGSTMDEAKSNSRHGAVVCCALQTAGRGRTAERRWFSKEGESLTFTLSLALSEITFPVTTVPLRSALALVKFLEKRFSLVCKIKWPNDVLVEGRKIAGILSEAGGGFVRVGIGLNCRQEGFPDDLRRPATSLFLTTRGLEGPLELWAPFLGEPSRGFFCIEGGGLPAEVEPLLYGLGEEMEYHEGRPGEARPVRGRVYGIGPEGELQLLRKSGKIISIY